MEFKKEFEQLLESMSLSSESSVEEYNAVWDKIDKLLLPNIPQQLFRFRTCSLDSIMALQSGKISTCVARAFKDKYDSLIYVDKNSFESRLRELTKTDILYDMLCNEEVCKCFEKIVGKERVEETVQKVSMLPKEEWGQMVSDKVTELIEYALSLIDSNVDYVRCDSFSKIACFSEDVKSLRMWDTYADGYRGFALEYDFRDFRGCRACPNNSECVNEERNFSHLFPVIYTDKRYDATDCVVSLVQRNMLLKLGVDSCPPIDQMFWYKPYLYKNAESYMHEKEWRIISHCSTRKNADYAEISDWGTLKAIYYGPDMEKRYRDFLRLVAKEKKLREYDVFVDPYSPDFELKVVPCQ